MKLRVRPFDSKETLRIDISGDSSLQQLKDAVAQAIAITSSSPCPSPSSLHLSLNRSDELGASTPHASLISLGIAAGDLIFYSLGSPEPEVETETLGDPPVPRDSGQVIDLDIRAKDSVTMEESGGSGEERMEIDGEFVDLVGGRFPESCFLRRMRTMLSEDFGEDRRNHKHLVIAVHSVFLESGFVDFIKFQFPDEWKSSMAFAMSFYYTLPEILGHQDCTLNVRESVVLKFQFIGHFVNVFGSLTSGGDSVTYRVCLDENLFAPAIGSLCGNGNKFEREVYELWKIVKDGLVLPLLIDLCAKVGLPSPPCFMRLPSELQIKILEFLPGVDIARVGCVCKELQYLSSNNDLWKKKFVKEFGTEMGGSQAVSAIHWKNAFVNSINCRVKRKEEIEMAAAMRRQRLPRYGWPMYTPIRRDPNPLEVPGIIGGDYDRFPGLVPPPFGRQGRLPLFRRTFSPHCNFGGSSRNGLSG